MRCRRLHATTADPKRPQGDLRATNRQDSTGAAAMAGPSISRIKKIIFFRPPVSVPLISLDQYRTERYSNDCMAHLGVPRGIRAYRARTGAGARNLKPRAPVSVNRKPETYHNSEAETCNLQPTSRPLG